MHSQELKKVQYSQYISSDRLSLQNTHGNCSANPKVDAGAGEGIVTI